MGCWWMCVRDSMTRVVYNMFINEIYPVDEPYILSGPEIVVGEYDSSMVGENLILENLRLVDTFICGVSYGNILIEYVNCIGSY